MRDDGSVNDVRTTLRCTLGHRQIISMLAMVVEKVIIQ
jgi:hypothetical protein